MNNLKRRTQKSEAGHPASDYPLRSIKILIGFILLFATVPLCEALSQNISKYYVLSKQSHGNLYFIYPESGFKSTTNNHKMVFDITYPDTNEVATFNFTYKDKEEIKIDSISLGYQSEWGTFPVNKIYTEFQSQWVYRLGAEIPFCKLMDFFRSDTPPSIRLISQSRIIDLEVSESRWRKLAKIYPRIFEVIILNKN